MSEPKFNNKPNEHLMLGLDTSIHKIRRDIWISRACAVVGIVFAFGVEGGTRVLVIKRSKKMRDEPNKYGAPSGYLDFNESGFDGMTREVFEETSMYLPDYNSFLKFDNNKQPFFVQDDPKKDRNQNISLTYIIVYDFIGHQDFFPINIENYTDHETIGVEWLKLSDFYNESKEWAFNHDERIKMALEYFNENYIK